MDPVDYLQDPYMFDNVYNCMYIYVFKEISLNNLINLSEVMIQKQNHT